MFLFHPLLGGRPLVTAEGEAAQPGREDTGKSKPRGGASRPIAAAAVVLAILAVAGAGAALFSERDGDPKGARSAPSVGALEKEARSWLRSQGVAGVVVGVSPLEQAGRVVPAGFASRDSKIPLRGGDRFHVGSISKTFVAAAILQLVDEGKLALDDPASEFVSAVPSGWGVTIRHLLSHQSGLPEYNQHPRFVEEIGRNLSRTVGPLEVLGWVLGPQPAFRPGERFEYAGTNYLVLGLVLEQVTGQRLRDELARRFFRPLGLDDTELPSPERPLRGLVHGYSTRWAHHFGEQVVDTSRIPGQAIRSAAWAEGGLVSSVPDLLRWTRALYAGDVLSPSLRREMVTFGTEKGPYGLGAYRISTPRGPAFGHGGVFFGFLAEMAFLPESGLAVAVAANGDGADLRGLADKVIAATLSPNPGEPKADTTDALVARLETPDAAARREAALELGRRTRDAALAVPALARTLERDPDPKVRSAAALALGLVGKGEPAAATKALMLAAGDPSPEVKQAAQAARQMLTSGGERNSAG